MSNEERCRFAFGDIPQSVVSCDLSSEINRL